MEKRKRKLKKVVEKEKKIREDVEKETQRKKLKREEIQRNAIIGYKIKQLRVNNNYTQTEVADLLNVSPQHYGTLERGVNSLTLENLINICNLYKVPLVNVVGDVNVNEQKCNINLEKLLTNINGLSKEHKSIIEYLVKYFELIEKEGMQERQDKTEKLIEKEFARIDKKEKEEAQKALLMEQSNKKKNSVRKKK